MRDSEDNGDRKGRKRKESSKDIFLKQLAGIIKIREKK